MATIPSTVAEFNADVVKFMDVSGNKSNSQEKVKAAHKCVTLRYLGLSGVSDDELETCAMHLQIVTEGATRRGWDL
jgi:hypothetical protein